MDDELPAELTRKLAELDAFIEREIAPLRSGQVCSAGIT